MYIFSESRLTVTQQQHKKPPRKAKGKFKVNLLQTWTGPEGTSRFRLPDFETMGV
jgi:hypothetical protein